MTSLIIYNSAIHAVRSINYFVCMKFLENVLGSIRMVITRPSIFRKDHRSKEEQVSCFICVVNGSGMVEIRKYSFLNFFDITYVAFIYSEAFSFWQLCNLNDFTLIPKEFICILKILEDLIFANHNGVPAPEKKKRLVATKTHHCLHWINRSNWSGLNLISLTPCFSSVFVPSRSRVSSPWSIPPFCCVKRLMWM